MIEHEKLGAELSGKNFDEVFLCGDAIKSVRKHMGEAFYFNKKDDLIEALKARHFKDAIILIKASRSLGLEELVDYI